MNTILNLLEVPEEIVETASSYLYIIFLGMPFTYLYNTYSAVMRSVGNSKTPIYFLAFASALNGILDFIFIAKFHMGVEGAAFATVLAESTSAFL